MKQVKLHIRSASGKTLASGGERIWYDAEYNPGDSILLEVPAPGYYKIRLEDTLGEELVYLKETAFCFPIPFGNRRSAYSPRSFTGAAHYLSARPATKAEQSQCYNLARNVYDCHGNESCFPHASANVETRNESVFAARNVIDGVICPWCHGAYPFGSWGINQRPDATWNLDFGRAVVAETLVLYLRADFPHDAWWKSARLTLSNGEVLRLPLQKTGEAQRFDLHGAVICGLTLDKLEKADDPSPFPALTQVELWGKNL